ncbi:MAG: hypothetical protein WEA58_10600 [Balneolaceae bacterium]
MKIYPLSVLLIALFIAFTATETMAQQVVPTDRYYSVPQDNQAFFFQPSNISIYQAGVFGGVMDRFSKHPLSAINRNPAGLNNIDTQNYLYVDVKTVPEENLIIFPSGCVNCITQRGISSPTSLTIAGPRNVSKRTQEPFLSAAYFVKTHPDSPLRFGMTYQLMSIDNSFYQLRSQPHNPYEIGLYFNNLLSTPSTSFPDDREQHRTLGHFPSFYTAFEFSTRFSAGLKISYNDYSGNGLQITEDFGTQPDPTQGQTTTISRDREVHYSHWDFSAGVQVSLNESVKTGVSAGFLTGNFDQDGRGTYLQDYLNPDDYSDDFYYSMFGDMFTRERFTRTGNTYYADTDIEFEINDNSQIQVNYRISRSDQEFNFDGSSFMKRDIENSSPDDDETVLWFFNEQERNILTRGEGDSELWQHNFSTGFRHNLGNGFGFQTGLQINFDVDKESFNDLQQQLSDYYSYRETGGEMTEEQRVVNDIRSLNNMQVSKYRATGFLPLIISKSFGPKFYIELGVMGHYRSEIYKLSQQLEYDYFSQQIGDEEASSEHQSSSIYDQRYVQNETLFNGFSSITFSPDSRLSFILMGFSDRRQINRVRSLDALRLKFSAEIGF